MSWAIPTASEVKAGNTVLADVTDELVEGALAMASVEVPTSLPNQVIFTRAVHLYVAHDLTIRGHGSSPEAQLSQTASLASASDGASSFTRRSATSSNGQSTFSDTSFGLQYSALVRRYSVPFLGLGTKG